MRIVSECDVSGADGHRAIYTVEVARGCFVEVMYHKEEALVYVMQNEDGSLTVDRFGGPIKCSLDPLVIEREATKTVCHRVGLPGKWGGIHD